MSRRSAFILLVIVILITVVGIGLRVKSPTPQKPAKTGLVGELAPDFKLPLVGGGEVNLSDLRGKIVMVNFWATWCPPCKAEMPSMERLYSRFKNSGFELLAVNAEVDGLEVLPEFLQKHKHTFPVPVDTEGEVQAAYGVFRFPESFVVGRDGIILEHVIGGRDWSDRQTIEHFADLTQGK
ncbi:MAG TPA: TlpA disulfide reductase family protein [Geothermobacteraceae bacterium]|nr:TlpA disulfide reductase family protein [Geothermobacteraceae bacterium]